MQQQYTEPYPLCTYSRVCKEKGISDAIDAVIEVNKRANRVVCTLEKNLNVNLEWPRVLLLINHYY